MCTVLKKKSPELVCKGDLFVSIIIIIKYDSSNLVLYKDYFSI